MSSPIVRPAAAVAEAPFRTPMLTQTGIMTKPWVDYFESLKRLGTSFVDVALLQALTQDGPGLVGEITDLQALQSLEPASLQSAIDLEKAQASASDYSGQLGSKLSDVEQLVALFQLNDSRTGSSSILEGTHAVRLTTSASDNPNTLFYETDRKVLYISAAGVWTFAAGAMVDTAANRPAGFGANDANFLFIASDTLALQYWTGAAWVTINSVTTPTTLTLGIRAVSGNTTITTADFMVYEFGAGSSTFTLADATTCIGQIFCFKCTIGVGDLTLAPVGGQAIDGHANMVLYQSDAVWLQSDGADWKPISLYTPNAYVWTTFTTAISPSTGTWTPAGQVCSYRREGKKITIRIFVAGSLSAGAKVSLSFPVAQVDNDQTFAGVSEQGGTFVPMAATCTAGGVVTSSLAIGNQNIYVQGVYEAA